MVANFNPSWRGITAALRLAVVAAGGTPSVSVYPANWGGCIRAIDELRAAIVAASPASAVAAHVALADPHAQYATDTDLTTHTGNTSNPHATTAAQVGAATTADLTTHTGNTSNPHATTAAQVGAATATQGTNADNHIAASANLHGLPASVNVLGNRNAAGEFIQRGVATASGTLVALVLNNYRSITVTFPVAFAVAPRVFCCGANTGTPATAAAIGTSTFLMLIWGDATLPTTYTGNYIALGT